MQIKEISFQTDTYALQNYYKIIEDYKINYDINLLHLFFHAYPYDSSYSWSIQEYKADKKKFDKLKNDICKFIKECNIQPDLECLCILYNNKTLQNFMNYI